MGNYALEANTRQVVTTRHMVVAALSTNTTADDNTAIGKSSLLANTTGTTNTAVGKDSLKANTTGDAKYCCR